MSSTIPAVLDRLVTIGGVVSAANVAPDVQVIDGQPTNVENNYLAVGFTRDPESYAVDIEEDFLDLGHSSSEETYTVECEASCWSGDADPKTVRDMAFALFDAYKTAVNDDPDLWALVDTVTVRRGGVIQGLEGEGSVCTVPFGLQIHAYTQP